MTKDELDDLALTYASKSSYTHRDIYNKLVAKVDALQTQVDANKVDIEKLKKTP